METEQALQYQIQLIDEHRVKTTLPGVYYSLDDAMPLYRQLDRDKRPNTFVVMLNRIVEYPTDSAMCAELPEYNGWRATYEYPGYIFYHHPKTELCICISSDFNGQGMLDVQVHNPVTGWYDDGRGKTSGGGELPWPYEGRSAAKMFELVKPFLDEYQSIELCRACEGDGIIMADSSTPQNERVTRDSRRCNYCGGKGWVR